MKKKNNNEKKTEWMEVNGTEENERRVQNEEEVD